VDLDRFFLRPACSFRTNIGFICPRNITKKKEDEAMEGDIYRKALNEANRASDKLIHANCYQFEQIGNATKDWSFWQIKQWENYGLVSG
jgi:hypothetical protein